MIARVQGALLGVVSMVAMSSHAFAQASTTGVPEGEAGNQAAVADGAQPDGTATTGSDVVVTGSRVVRNGDAAPTPVTLVRTEDLLKQTPSTIADGLNALPVFAGGRGPATQIQTTGNNAGGNGAANQLNLRGLGPTRNLILFDNQRLPSALFSGVVDVDIVPDPLVERVDVVTGGVSAVYGSDAISGVVNFVTNKKFNGVKMEANAGISQRGDAPQQKISVTGGTGLGERAHIEASYTYIHSDPIPYRSNRPFALDYAYGGLNLPVSTFGAAGTVNNPYVLIRGGTRNSSASTGGKVTGLNAATQAALGLGSGANGYNFSSDGVLSLFNTGQVTASTNLSIGGDGYLNNASLGATQNSHAAFGRFDYELSDTARFHVQALANVKDNTVYGNYGVFTNFTIKATNAYLPTNLRNALAAGGQQVFTFAKALTNGPRLKDDVRTEQYYVNAGFDGTFGTFDWAIDGNYGRATLKNRLSNNVNNQHLAAAADATTNAAGQIVCGINADAITTNDDPACVPINLFGPTAANQAAYNYVFGTVNLRAVTETLDFNGHVGGELFDLLGAGAARFALSGEYRRNSLKEDVDYSSTDVANCSGLSILTANTATTRSYASNCVPAGATALSTSNGVTTSVPLTPTALFVNAFAPLAKKTQEVKEVALEVLLPLLKDSAVARELSVTGAVRYADYNTTGSTWVWKAGVSWQVIDSLRFRGTVSRDFRAPTLNDLYQPVTVQVAGNADLLTGVAFLQSRTQGNPNLQPEVGHTWTAGGVFKPTFLPGFSLAVDYYHIRISNAIQQVQGLTPAVQSACLASGGTSPFCLLQPRPNGYTDTSPSNAPFYWLTQNLNFAEITTEGVDTDVGYTTRLFGRPLGARLLVTWQPHVIYANQPGTGATTTFDAAGAAAADGTINFIAAKWRINGSVHVEPVDSFSIDVRERWRSGLRYNPVSTTYFAQRVSDVATTDLSLTFKLPGNVFEFYGNVLNLFDKAPPAFQQGILPGQGFVPGDDYVGRYFIAGIRAKL